MPDLMCIIDVGHRDGARAVWRDLNAPHVVVCDRHRRQYDERPDLGPFCWASVDTPEQDRRPHLRPHADIEAAIGRWKDDAC